MKTHIPLMALAGVGLTFCAVALSQSAGFDNEPYFKTTVLSERQQREIDLLEREIAGKRQKLDYLRRASKTSTTYYIPSMQPRVAVIVLMGSTRQFVKLGRKDGFQSADRLVVMRRSKGAKADELKIVGYCVIEQLYEKDMQLVAHSDIGIRPEDEVYIANRENSPYSLAFARLW